MRIERPPILLFACWLGACSFGGAGTDITVHQPRYLPMSLAAVDSAIFFQYGGSDPEDGRGQAIAFLADRSLDCGDADVFTTSLYGQGEGAGFFDGNGLLLLFIWSQREGDNAGWEGFYPAGATMLSEDGDLSRTMLVAPWSEGALYLDRGFEGIGEIQTLTEDSVSGTVRSALLDATFAAENCGTVSREYDDTAYSSYDTAR